MRAVRETPWITEHLIDTDAVVIAFTGFYTPDGKAPAFQFTSLASETAFSAILVMDPANTWYHGESPGIGTGCRALASYLAERTSGYRRVICLGSSMGGYAALLFGRLLGADRVLAFSPQVVLDPAVLRAVGDLRWIDQMDRIHAMAIEPAFADLSRLLAIPTSSKTIFTVYVPADYARDAWHTALLRAFPAVVVDALPARRHNLLGPLRRFGILRRLIGQIATGKFSLDVRAALSAEQGRRLHEFALAGMIHDDGETRTLRVVTSVTNRSREPWDAATGFLSALAVECRLIENATGRTVFHAMAGLPVPFLAPGEADLQTFTLPYADLPAGLYEARFILCESDMPYATIGYDRLAFVVELCPDVSLLWLRTPTRRTGRFRRVDAEPPRQQVWVPELDPLGTWRFEARDMVLQTRTGLNGRHRILLDAAPAGFALYGPYASLPAGSYTAEILFDPFVPVDGVAVADVARDFGVVLVERPVTFRGEAGVVIRLAFTLADASVQIEVRLRNEAGFTGSIMGVRIVDRAAHGAEAEVRTS